MTPRIRKAKALNPGPSRREIRHKKDRKAEDTQRIAGIFAEAARKHAGRALEPRTEPPERPPKPRTERPAWMVKQETQALGWAWKPTISKGVTI